MVYPVIALRGLTILPKMRANFDIGRSRSIAAVEQAMMQDQRVLLVTQRDVNVNEPKMDDLFEVGTVGVIRQLAKLPDQSVRIVVEGLKRVELMALDDSEEYLNGVVEDLPVEETSLKPIEKEAMVSTLREQMQIYSKVETNFGETALKQLEPYQTLEELLPQLMIRFPVQGMERQDMLELNSTYDQFTWLMEKMVREMEIGRIKNEIQEKVKANIDKNQRDYILREQMQVIRKELGDDAEKEAERYRKKIRALKATAEVKEKLLKEVDRLGSMPGPNQEAYVLRTYIDTCLEMPWSKISRESRDIKRADRILQEEHYGLEKIKERILEYLAVRIFSGNQSGTILCLVGPPGTGKTSIAHSIAHALNKKYVRVSLGGVHDEAEIRGHRRTYVGSMPGRIAVGMKQAGVSNPLMLLDEIDKVGSDYKGDISAALLEVLDSEQNSRFMDHYLEMPMDLSRVMFIATANNLATIPRPLLDRMDIIELGAYTENEKYHIAEDYLLKKQREKNGLREDQLEITEEAVRRMIHNYTREAGVRNLERRIGDICRKAAREILEKKAESICVKAEDLEHFLGKEKMSYQMVNEEDEVGVVRGLAWTAVGGDTLEIEVNVMPGKGNLVLTGRMGDVMKESARTGLSYIRSVADRYDIDPEFFNTHDIHIHIPDGATPKDGPSAGITMTTAMLSAITGRKVKADLAMTGEVTIRGRVLPIGGLKEKLLAAKMADIHHILVPVKNQSDVEELSEEVTGGLLIEPVSRMSEVIERSFAE